MERIATLIMRYSHNRYCLGIDRLYNWSISNPGKPFYASDIGLNGGSISALSINGYIDTTGNAKKVLYQLGNSDYYRKGEIKEWYICDPERVKRDYEHEMNIRTKLLNSILEIANEIN